MRRKSFSLSGSIAVVMFLVAAAVYFITQEPDLGKYESLKEPRIANMPDQKMVEVTAAGDPNVVGGKAFKLLFKVYYKIPEVSKGAPPAPRARWKGDMAVKSSWTGFYALPVPPETGSLPAVAADPGLQVRLTTWEYGDVAEILHVGPYDRETPTIQKLHDFAAKMGYRIIGDHEEEYIKGPGMFFKGNPEQYRTIIRCRVKKKEQGMPLSWYDSGPPNE